MTKMFKAASKTATVKTAGSVDGVDSCVDSGDSLGSSGDSGVHGSSEGEDGNSDGGNGGKRAYMPSTPAQKFAAMCNTCCPDTQQHMHCSDPQCAVL